MQWLLVGAFELKCSQLQLLLEPLKELMFIGVIVNRINYGSNE